MQLINIPIEPLEERYSIQWQQWFSEYFNKENISFENIYGGSTSGKIHTGSFLDVKETLMWKSSQLRTIISYLTYRETDTPTVLFFHDLWFPGLESIFYLRDALGLKNLKITGCLHAGSYDDYDFLAKKGMARWAGNLEKSWLSEVDAIFVATQFHADLIKSSRDAKNVYVTGFPIRPNHGNKIKKKIIVFPHRMDEEKQPDLFVELRNRIKKKYGDTVLCLFTKEETSNKSQYYDLLSRSYIAVSFALQETWGIAMQEAVFAGCIPLVPDRLSYSELYEDKFKYKTGKELEDKIDLLLEYPDLFPTESQFLQLKQSGEQAIPNMIQIIKSLYHEKTN